MSSVRATASSSLVAGSQFHHNATESAVHEFDARSKALTTVITLCSFALLLGLAWIAHGVRSYMGGARGKRSKFRTSIVKKERRMTKNNLTGRQRWTEEEESSSIYSQRFEGEINRAFVIESNVDRKLFCKVAHLENIAEEEATLCSRQPSMAEDCESGDGHSETRERPEDGRRHEVDAKTTLITAFINDGLNEASSIATEETEVRHAGDGGPTEHMV